MLSNNTELPTFMDTGTLLFAIPVFIIYSCPQELLAFKKNV
jgi:membrane protein CcdC involved in cytochrome C biogenesis